MKLFDIVVAIKAETAVMARSAIPLDSQAHRSHADLDVAQFARALALNQRGEMRAAIARVRAQLNQLEALL